MSSLCQCFRKLRDMMQRSLDEFMRSMSRMQGEKTSFHEVTETDDKPPPQTYSAPPEMRSYETVTDKPQLPTIPELRVLSTMREVPELQNNPELLEGPIFRAVPEYRELPGDKIKSRAEDGGPQVVMRSGVPQMRTISIEKSKESSSESAESKENEDVSVKQRSIENSGENKSIQIRTHTTIDTEDNDLDPKEIKGNTLELEEEYDQKRERDTEWDQGDYDNFDWEDGNDIDEIKVYNDLPKKSIDLRGDTYVNDLLAGKGAKINPDAEFIPPRTRNNEREEMEYEGLLPHQRQRNYYDDTNVNNILASRNTAINPDAEFIPPSSKYSTPIEVHYGYEIDDYQDNNNVDLSRDTDVNKILAARGAPTNPDAEMIDPSYKENKNRESASRHRGQYSGDIYVNEILKSQGAPINPDAELFTPEELIEFVSLETEQSNFKNMLRGNRNAHKISNPDATRVDVRATEQRSGRRK